MPLVTSKRVWTQQPRFTVSAQTFFGLPITHLWALNVAGEMAIADSAGNAPGVFDPGTVKTGVYWANGHDGSQYTEIDNTGTGTVNSTTIFVGDTTGSGAPKRDIFTFLCRFYATSLPGNEGNIYCGPAGGVGIRITPGGLIQLMKENFAQVAITSNAFSFSAWHWLAVSYDGTTAKFYLDKTAVESGGSSYSFVKSGQYTFCSRYVEGSGAVYRLENGSKLSNVMIVDGVLSSDAIHSYFDNPWQAFKKQDRRILIPSAGGGGLSLTGSLTGQGSTLSASATNTEVHALSGVLVGAGSTLSGTATRIYSLTGSLTGQGATLSGSATTLESHAATGALVGAGSTLSATATNTEIHAATGALVGAGSSLSATATNTEIHAATGSLIGAGSTLSGSATHTPVGINASGSLVGQGATLSAMATNTEVHTCTGALYGQGATLSGALTRVFSASGSLVGAGSTLSATAGNAVAVFSATGSLVGQGSTLTGSATNTETHAVSGSLAGQGATLSATAALANLHTLSGSLVGSGSILVGYAAGPTTAFDAPPDAIVAVINKRNRVSVISRRS